MSDGQGKAARCIGRGSSVRPPNRFERVAVEDDFEQLAADDELLIDGRAVTTEFLPDRSQSLIAKNDSPDIPFSCSINPYRGCEHGCAYCYARPSHELLGMDAGLDFETKVMVKYDAVKLLRAELNRPNWQPEWIALSGVTDCYQPIERKLRITRGLLEVMLEARQPVGIVTKNALVVRDLDVLVPLARRNLVHVNVSVTTLDADLARRLEPRTSSPEARLRAIRALSAAGVPTGAMVAPIIPGLNDETIPAVLAAVAEAGASAATYTLLRLPLAVRPVFEAWLAQHEPAKRPRIESLIRATRDGAMSDARYGTRMRGQGEYAEGIARTFEVFAAKHSLDRRLPELDTSQFRPPRSTSGQLRLF